MELVDLNFGFTMSGGGSQPLLMADEASALISFYIDTYIPDTSSFAEDKIATIKFVNYPKVLFGFPDIDRIGGHPYYSLGMRPYSAYELIDSDLITSLAKIDSHHNLFSKPKWEKYHHYLLLFHDSLFECVAENYEILPTSSSMAEAATKMSEHLMY